MQSLLILTGKQEKHRELEQPSASGQHEDKGQVRIEAANWVRDPA